MDKAEELAERYLKSCGFSSVIYEPDGNVPPDFLCGGHVAVEVRRLNQSFQDGIARRGLAETEVPLLKRMELLLPKLGPPVHDRSWFVFYRFSRPLPKWKILERAIVQQLKDFAANPVPFDKRLLPGFELSVFAASKVHESCFILGGFIDAQSGGWVISEVVENLTHAIAGKTEKVAPYRHRYPTWWLVFVDQIAYGFDEFDQKAFRTEVRLNHAFDKVILLDPNNPRRSFEL